MKALLVPTILALAATAALAEQPARPEPRVQRTVLEDDHVRIEELRVRGLNVSLVVKPKNAAEYEVVVAPGGRDPSQAGGASKGAAGKSVWHLFSF